MAKLCARCELQIVHESRDFHLCLDCLIILLIKKGSLEIPKYYEANRFEERMARKGLCHKCGQKKREYENFWAFCRCDGMINEFGQFTLPAWNQMLSAEEVTEGVYVHGDNCHRREYTGHNRYF